MDVHFLALAIHLLNLRNVEHPSIWTSWRRFRARFMLSVIELIRVIHHQSFDIEIESGLRKLNFVWFFTSFALACDHSAKEDGIWPSLFPHAQSPLKLYLLFVFSRGKIFLKFNEGVLGAHECALDWILALAIEHHPHRLLCSFWNGNIIRYVI